VSRPVVAAVCYRRRSGSVQFLLVRTERSGTWTFPKGRVERWERDMPWHAALREAREEAGALGRLVSRAPFARYRYLKGAVPNPGKEDSVAAYLLEVERRVAPDESWRRPAWCTPRQAARRLGAGGRAARYAREHERVLTKAATLRGPRVVSPRRPAGRTGRTGTMTGPRP
jgi:8-oxo-dGTP pyrophosphatase MutT (NUDIX family)